MSFPMKLCMHLAQLACPKKEKEIQFMIVLAICFGFTVHQEQDEHGLVCGIPDQIALPQMVAR